MIHEPIKFKELLAEEVIETDLARYDFKNMTITTTSNASLRALYVEARQLRRYSQYARQYNNWIHYIFIKIIHNDIGFTEEYEFQLVKPWVLFEHGA